MMFAVKTALYAKTLEMHITLVRKSSQKKLLAYKMRCLICLYIEIYFFWFEKNP